MENYLIAMAVTACIYALMALGLNVIWGFAGMVNLGLIGFFAVGAYGTALTTLKLGFPMVAGMATGAALAAAAAECKLHVVAGLVERLVDRLHNAAILAEPSGAVRLVHRKVNELDIALDLRVK